MNLNHSAETCQKHFITDRGIRIDDIGFMPTYNKQNGDVIGKVINLSSNGICILIDEYHGVDDELQLVIDVVDSNGNNKEIELNCKLKWIDKNAANDMFVAGFAIKFSNLKSKMRYQKLLEKLN